MLTTKTFVFLKNPVSNREISPPIRQSLTWPLAQIVSILFYFFLLDISTQLQINMSSSHTRARLHYLDKTATKKPWSWKNKTEQHRPLEKYSDDTGMSENVFAFDFLHHDFLSLTFFSLWYLSVCWLIIIEGQNKDKSICSYFRTFALLVLSIVHRYARVCASLHWYPICSYAQICLWHHFIARLVIWLINLVVFFS